MALLRVRYQNPRVWRSDIHVRTLRDNQEFDDIDGEVESSVFPPQLGCYLA